MQKLNLEPKDIMAAPATVSSNGFTLVWDKPDVYENVSGYKIYQNETVIAETSHKKTHFTVTSLSENTSYEYQVESIAEAGDSLIKSTKLSVRTKPAGKVIDVTKPPYNADSTGKSICTQILQMAIDSCKEGDTILIPEGACLLSGAIDLKSNITLCIDGVLTGSTNPQDYVIKKAGSDSCQSWINEDGLILTRYEGWEMYCYRSLINAGYLCIDDRRKTTCENIRICGNGRIVGAGNDLGMAMKKNYSDKEKYPEYVSDDIGGRRVRGRLLGLIQCRNVHITGVSIENPPCWTIHPIYCDTITIHGICIKSRGIDNGDGIDPDSSRNIMIFDTVFDTGDDCIAIKSGKNPEGNKINIPTEHVRIFDLKMIGGHGMAIGSEQSGGVRDVYMRDCVIKNTLYGLELKAHDSRGGYIKKVRMIDCEIDRFLAHSVKYNADGMPADTLPYFQDIEIKNTRISGSGKTLELIGFSDDAKDHYIKNVLVEDVILAGGNDMEKQICLKNCENVIFRNITLEGRN